MPLNDTTIRGIKPPEKGQKDHTDQHGLTLRVSQGGSKTFVFRHGASGHRITIGNYPLISLAQARQRARELAAEITLHGHKTKSLSFAESLDLFVTNHLKSKNGPQAPKRPNGYYENRYPGSDAPLYLRSPQPRSPRSSTRSPKRHPRLTTSTSHSKPF